MLAMNTAVECAHENSIQGPSAEANSNFNSNQYFIAMKLSAQPFEKQRCCGHGDVWTEFHANPRLMRDGDSFILLAIHRPFHPGYLTMLGTRLRAAYPTHRFKSSAPRLQLLCEMPCSGYAPAALRKNLSHQTRQGWRPLEWVIPAATMHTCKLLSLLFLALQLCSLFSSIRLEISPFLIQHIRHDATTTRLRTSEPPP
jgi:hypothetical protein